MNQNTRHGWHRLAALLMSVTIAACGRGASQEADGAQPGTGGTAAGAAQTVSAQDRDAIVQGLRTELARLLKRDAGQLTVDAPVTELGASDLDIVEWQMAAERTFRVDIADDKLFDPQSKGARKDLTIAAMAEAVATARPWPEGRTR